MAHFQDADAERKFAEAKRLKWEATTSEKAAAEHRASVDGVVLELEKQRLELGERENHLTEVRVWVVGFFGSSID